MSNASNTAQDSGALATTTTAPSEQTSRTAALHANDILQGVAPLNRRSLLMRWWVWAWASGSALYAGTQVLAERVYTTNNHATVQEYQTKIQGMQQRIQDMHAQLERLQQESDALNTSVINSILYQVDTALRGIVGEIEKLARDLSADAKNDETSGAITGTKWRWAFVQSTEDLSSTMQNLVSQISSLRNNHTWKTLEWTQLQGALLEIQAIFNRLITIAARLPEMQKKAISSNPTIAEKQRSAYRERQAHIRELLSILQNALRTPIQDGLTKIEALNLDIAKKQLEHGKLQSQIEKITQELESLKQEKPTPWEKVVRIIPHLNAGQTVLAGIVWFGLSAGLIGWLLTMLRGILPIEGYVKSEVKADVQKQHPDWTEEQITEEVGKRMDILTQEATKQGLSRRDFLGMRVEWKVPEWEQRPQI